MEMQKIVRAKVTRVYRESRSTKARYVINVGGARSTKSYSTAQLLIEKFNNERHKKFLVTRKTMPALRLTAYKLIIDLMKLYKIYNPACHNKSQNKYESGTNFMLFTSIDDPEKIKSSEWNYEWLEESNEFTWNDIIILKTRLSGKTTTEEPNQMFFSQNPVDELGWLNQKIILNKSYSKIRRVIESSYKDNPFLDEEYVRDLEALKERDPNYWRIYGLGKWGKLLNIIYASYEVETEYPKSFNQIIYGLDFGYNSPSGLLEIGDKDKEFFLTELLYQTHLTNQDLIEKLKILIPANHRKRYIYADSAEPDRIEEIKRAGFNIHPSNKSVKDGLDFCKRKKFHTKSENVNLNKERQSYKYKEDKNKNVLEEPLEFDNHLMDAKRYAMYTHYKKSKSGAMVTVIE